MLDKTFPTFVMALLAYTNMTTNMSRLDRMPCWHLSVTALSTTRIVSCGYEVTDRKVNIQGRYGMVC